MGTFQKKLFRVLGHRLTHSEGEMKIESFGRVFIAKPGDWIISGPSGQKTVLDDHLFRELYEAADEDGKKELDESFSPVGRG